jgi:hypothetical protein
MLLLFSISMSLLFLYLFFFNIQKKKKKLGEKMHNFYFLLIAFQILHVFFPDILVHCALIKYSYI